MKPKIYSNSIKLSTNITNKDYVYNFTATIQPMQKKWEEILLREIIKYLFKLRPKIVQCTNCKKNGVLGKDRCKECRGMWVQAIPLSEIL